LKIVVIDMEESVAKKKVELQARGIQIPQEYMEEMESKYNFPGVRLGWNIFCFKAPNNKIIHTFVSGGEFTKNSPYRLVKDGDEWDVYKGDEKYVSLAMTPRPKFYEKTTSDGAEMMRIATMGSPSHMNVVRTMQCVYAEKGNPCTFCAYRNAWAQEGEKTAQQIGEVVEAAVSEGVVQHVSITTGTLPTKDKGLQGIIDAAKEISKRVDVPIKCSFEPQQDLGLIDEAYSAGIDVTSINIECFDEKVRAEVLPNAKGNTPYEKYFSNLDRCVELFGKNQVFSVVPLGLGDPDSATLKGVEMISSHNVIPWVEPFHPLPGALWEDRTPMNPDRIMNLYKEVVQILKKYDLNLSVTKAGCVKVGVYGALKEVEEYET
jgi:radical SAM protein (TIGR04043 family)